jgi:signal transduction histidine kinase
MRLAQFLIGNLEEILIEWAAFARSLLNPGQTPLALRERGHATQILLAIAADIDASRPDPEQASRSKGALRHLAGFDLRHLTAEFRALRASVLRLYLKRGGDNASASHQVMRFNEALDHALCECIAIYSDEVARSRDTFLAILGHDLRSPLAAIANSSLYLGAPGLLPAGSPLDALRCINRGVLRMDSMIKDLLEYTRTRLGRAIPISPRVLSMEQLCRIAYDEIRAAHPERTFRLETSGQLDGHFDGERLQRALANLLSNAVQHGAKNQPITLSAHGEPDMVTIRVQNYGPSIPAEQLQVIFNPLVQIPAASAGEVHVPSTSLGLGLYIAREIVSMHGGTIEAASSDKDGTVFSAHLPRKRAEARV